MRESPPNAPCSTLHLLAKHGAIASDRGHCGPWFSTRSGSKWSEHVLEMAEKKWATGVIALPLEVELWAPTYNWRTYFALRSFVYKQKIIATKEVNRKRKKHIMGKRREFPSNSLWDGRISFCYQKRLRIEWFKMHKIFFYKEHLASNIPW